ncbi:hypothetical protein BX600DRAFT_555519 [Xylariales sp. PMI_506]|nr:hypothetical protein BX600DRAFT_555519 [Xylariales sp. PMI_506]
MSGINQLPAGAEGVAGFVLIYTTVSWICSCLLIWVAGLYREASSYIALLSYFTLFSNTASIVQQAYDITNYRYITEQQYLRRAAHPNNPELAISNGSFGPDLVLYYIQYYSYNVEAMLVMAFELAQSVFGLSARHKLKTTLRRINAGGKAFAILFPAVTILILRAPAVQNVFVLFILLADLPLMISLAISTSTMISILIRYIQSRRKVSQSTIETADTTISSSGVSEAITKSSKQSGLYDRWLMIRFTIAFVVLAIFEVTNTLFQLQSITSNQQDSASSEPDLSAGQAKKSQLLFLPGVTPGIFVFLVFGTTAGCRKAIRDTFTPRCWKRRDHESSYTHRKRVWPSRRKDGDGIEAQVGAQQQQQQQDPFADSWEDDEVKVSIAPGPGGYLPPLHHSGRGSFAGPLPIASLVSRYNTSFDANRDSRVGAGVTATPPNRSATTSPLASNGGGSGGDADNNDTDATNALRRSVAEVGDNDRNTNIPMQNLKRLGQIHEDYYSPDPEHSDDSGPILPIMHQPLTPRQSRQQQQQPRRISRGSIGVAVPLPPASGASRV